jgi:hypothetical protein
VGAADSTLFGHKSFQAIYCVGLRGQRSCAHRATSAKIFPLMAFLRGPPEHAETSLHWPERLLSAGRRAARRPDSFGDRTHPCVWIWTIKVQLIGELPMGSAKDIAKTTPEQLAAAYRAMNISDDD